MNCEFKGISCELTKLHFPDVPLSSPSSNWFYDWMLPTLSLWAWWSLPLLYTYKAYMNKRQAPQWACVLFTISFHKSLVLSKGIPIIFACRLYSPCYDLKSMGGDITHTIAFVHSDEHKRADKIERLGHVSLFEIFNSDV